jgi:hypothetical protein
VSALNVEAPTHIFECRRFFFFAASPLMAGRDARAPGMEARLIPRKILKNKGK